MNHRYALVSATALALALASAGAGAAYNPATTVFNQVVALSGSSSLDKAVFANRGEKSDREDRQNL